MSQFVPGQPILSREQQEQVIMNTFGIREPMPEVTQEVQNEETVQLTKAEYEQLLAGRQQTEPIQEQQVVRLIVSLASYSWMQRKMLNQL